MTDTTERLNDAVRDVMSHQWSNSRPAMQALTELVDAAEVAADTIEALRHALRALLADTQHAEHHCTDADCPVAAARAALGE